MRILIVEDDARVTDVVTQALRTSGHTVASACDCARAKEAFAEAFFDVAIVDIGLPDGSGLDLCRAARGMGLDQPILVLTAQNDVDHRVEGLDAGADDYLGKPFSTSELLARVRALGRRGPRWIEAIRSYGDTLIDRDRRTVVSSGLRVPLTPREFEVVAFLAWRDGRIAAREDILETVWGECSEGAAASLDVHMARIRRKLAEVIEGEVIRTVKQVGYAWALPRSKPR